MKRFLNLLFLCLLPFHVSLLAQPPFPPTAEINSTDKPSPSQLDAPLSHEKDPLSNQPNPFKQDPLQDTWQQQAPKEPEDFQAKFMNMLFMLALLIGLMVAASWFLKRMMKTRTTQLNESSVIKVLETRYLSPRATLYLVDVQGKTLLIGESHSGLAQLGTLSVDDKQVEPSSVARGKEFKLKPE